RRNCAMKAQDTTLEQNEAHPDAQSDGFSPAGSAQLIENRADVKFDGVIGNAEARSDLLVAQTVGHHAQDFNFACREFVESGWDMIRALEMDVASQFLRDFRIQYHKAGLYGLHG